MKGSHVGGYHPPEAGTGHSDLGRQRHRCDHHPEDPGQALGQDPRQEVPS